MKNVSAFDPPFAPLDLAIGWINADYTPFTSLRLWKITYQPPLNAIRAFIALISVRKVVVEEAQSRMNVLQQYEYGCGTEKVDEG